MVQYLLKKKCRVSLSSSNTSLKSTKIINYNHRFLCPYSYEIQFIRSGLMKPKRLMAEQGENKSSKSTRNHRRCWVGRNPSVSLSWAPDPHRTDLTTDKLTQVFPMLMEEFWICCVSFSRKKMAAEPVRFYSVLSEWTMPLCRWLGRGFVPQFLHPQSTQS